jgi:hypothetical protein
MCLFVRYVIREIRRSLCSVSQYGQQNDHGERTEQSETQQESQVCALQRRRRQTAAGVHKE